MVPPSTGPRTTPSCREIRPGVRLKSTLSPEKSMLLRGTWLPLATARWSWDSSWTAKLRTLNVPSCTVLLADGGSIIVVIWPPVMRE